MTKHPEPEVRARPALPDEIPGGCQQVIRIAEANGHLLTWLAHYARGTRLQGDRVQSSVVLRVMGRGEGYYGNWVAVWTEGKFDCAYGDSLSGSRRKLSSRELKEELRTFGKSLGTIDSSVSSAEGLAATSTESPDPG